MVFCAHFGEVAAIEEEEVSFAGLWTARTTRWVENNGFGPKIADAISNH